MEKKSFFKFNESRAEKIFLWFFFLLILGSIVTTYYRIVIKNDYIIEAQGECDPSLENCFVYECDPEFEECSGDPEEDTSYYKIVRRNASKISSCNIEDENCKPFECEIDEKECEEIFCNEETKTEDDTCITPEEYNVENNSTEEEDVCEENDVCEEENSEEESDSEEELTVNENNGEDNISENIKDDKQSGDIDENPVLE